VKRWQERVVVSWAWLSGLLLIAAVSAVLGYLLVKSLPVLRPALIFGDTPPIAALLFQQPVFDGLWPAMLGTVILVVLSVGLALPVGLAGGIFMAEYARGRTKAILSLFFDILAGIPSIVVGLFGFSVTVFLHHYFSARIFPCLLVSAMSLAFLVLPYLICTTQSALEIIPPEIRRIAPALGASQWQNIFYVLVPRGFNSIISGIVLAIGRCAEDTAVIMLTGAVAMAGVPHSLWATYEALPFYIYYMSAQYSDQHELMQGYGAAVILLVICAGLFLAAFAIKQRLSARIRTGR
jgi:phosphate transport system permease protein